MTLRERLLALAATDECMSEQQVAMLFAAARMTAEHCKRKCNRLADKSYREKGSFLHMLGAEECGDAIDRLLDKLHDPR